MRWGARAHEQSLAVWWLVGMGTIGRGGLCSRGIVCSPMLAAAHAVVGRCRARRRRTRIFGAPHGGAR